MFKKLCPVLFILMPLALMSATDTLNVKARRLIAIFEEYHYQAVTLDEIAFQEIKELFLRRLDPDFLFFTQTDWTSLLAIKLIRTDFTAGDSPLFFKKAVALYRERLAEAKKTVAFALKNPLPFKTPQTYGVRLRSYPDPAKSAEDLQTRMTQKLQGMVLEKLFEQMTCENPDQSIKDFFNVYEESARGFVGRRGIARIDLIINHPDGFEPSMASLFLDAIARRFDSHSKFLSAGRKNKFDSYLSKTALTFGFYIEKDAEANPIISRVVPGGPAWQSNQLNEGDIVLAIKFPETKMTTPDLQALGEKEINDLISEVTATRLELSVKKKDGIKGLILDLRNNSGGSLTEALAIAGIFLDEGPLIIQGFREGNVAGFRSLDRKSRRI